MPTVKRESQDESSSSQPTTTGKKMFYSKKVINKVNMVDEQDETMPAGGEEEKTHEQGDGEDEAEIEEMERQAQVLMTQASRRRAKVEQNRGFQRQETADQREARIQEMKSRMCCSACKAHGKTVYGHWHGDPVCPFYGQQGKNPKKEEGKGVFVVTQAGDELEGTSDEEAFMVNVSTIFQTMSFDPDVDASRLALSDTCCARTVSGEAWMRRFMKQLWDNGIEYLCLAEQQGFRFGPGPKILSTYSVVVPTCLGTKETNVFLKISVVPVEVPLLVSRPALAQLGAVLDLHESEVNFKAVGTRGKLFTTTSGHVGFYIVDTANDQVQAAVPDLWDLAQASFWQRRVIQGPRVWVFLMLPQSLLKLLGTPMNLMEKISLGMLTLQLAQALTWIVILITLLPLLWQRTPFSQLVKMTMLAPKLKAEYVAAIEARSSCSKQDLNKHTMDRLKEIWNLVKPTKVRVLPAGWRKFDLQGLKDLYADTVLPTYHLEEDGHWLRVRRGQLITQLEMYQTEMKEDMALQGEANPSNAPLCRECGISLIPRTNRVTQEGFYGCIRFPECRQTLPLSMAGLDVRQLEIKNLKKREKEKVLEMERPRRGYPNKGQESDGSWIPLPTDGDISEELEEDTLDSRINTNLTKAEMKMIEKMRAKAKAKARSSTPVDDKDI